MSGVARYRGNFYYAQCHQSPETRNFRYFWMYPLTPEETFQEIKYQEWFREYYGFNCDYDKHGRRGRKPENWKEWWWEKTRTFKKSGHQFHTKRSELKIDRERYIKREAIGFFTHYSRRKDRVYR